MGMQHVSQTRLFLTGTIYHYTIRGVIWCTTPSRIEQGKTGTRGLRAHNCQKWHSRFFTYPCYKIYWLKTVGLSFQLYFKNHDFLWVCETWHTSVKPWYFVNNRLFNVQTILFACVTHTILIIYGYMGSTLDELQTYMCVWLISICIIN